MAAPMCRNSCISSIYLLSKGINQALILQLRCLGKSTRAFSSDSATYSDEYANEERKARKERETLEEEEENIRLKILKHSLPYVNEYGWTKKTLSAGAESAGLPTITHGMFERGGAELIHYFYSSSNAQLADHLSERAEIAREKEEKLKVRPFIRDAIETRLRMITPYMSKWPQAMAIQTLPQNSVESWRNLSQLMDDIWFYAGDKSTDFNWYTKRVSLATIYKSTEIYMIQDKSEDFENTWEFLERRLNDMSKFGANLRNAQQFGTSMYEGLLGACIMTRNVLGANSRNR